MMKPDKSIGVGILAWIVGCTFFYSSVTYCASGRPTAAEVHMQERSRMVNDQIAGRDVTDPKVLQAMRKVERHLFVPDGLQREAYHDYPLPIGEGQTISQPYIVAKMTEVAGIKKGDKVLEIGTGSGYQAAVLAELGAEVYSIEIIEALSAKARRNLDAAGYNQVKLRVGDGYQGWKEAAPYDAIIVTAAPENVPQPLIDQLKINGRLVIPVGASSPFSHQQLKLVTKTEKGVEKVTLFHVAFVPMTGEAAKKERP